MRIAVIVAALIALHQNAGAAPTAAELFAEGQSAYQKADYKLAISRWQESYRLSKEPELLFNLAQAYRLAGDCENALRDYRLFLSADLESEQRPLAERYVHELDAKCSSPSPTPSPVDQAAHPPERSNSRYALRVAGLATAGTGAALIVTGLLFGRRASALGDEVTHDCATSCDWAIERSKEADGKRDATRGRILDGVGLAALAVGIGMYVYGARDEHPALTVQPAAHGASLSWSSRW